MTVKQKYGGAPWLYDEDSGDIVGIKSPDGSELLIMRIPYVGSFCDVSNQTASANTATAMECDTTLISHGVSVVDATKFTVTRKGTYNLQFSAQFTNSDSSAHRISVWLAKNGDDVADSCTDISVPAKHGDDNGAAVAAWNFFVELEPLEYVEIMWSTPDAKVTIPYVGERTTPVRPAVPSIIVTMNEINGSYP